MGADEATVSRTPTAVHADGRSRSAVLEAAISKRGPFDLIICGFASDDGYSFQTGPRLAERLGCRSSLTPARSASKPACWLPTADLEDGLETVSVGLPAIVSVAEEAFSRGPSTLLQAMKAQSRPTYGISLRTWGLRLPSWTRFPATRRMPRQGLSSTVHSRL